MVMRFHDALERALRDTRLSLKEACEGAGVSYNQMKKFMQRGRIDPNASTNVDDAVKIAHFFGVSLDEFLDDQTPADRSEVASLYRSLSKEELEILRDAARGRRAQSREGER